MPDQYHASAPMRHYSTGRRSAQSVRQLRTSEALHRRARCFLRWRHRKGTTRRISKAYVWKRDVDEQRRKGEPFFTEKEWESWSIALVECRRVNGKPRLKMIRYLGSFDPRRPPEPSWYWCRQLVRRVRALDISHEMKVRFLKEIEARGVSFAWPTSLDPMTQEEFDQGQREVEASLGSLADEIRALHQQIQNQEAMTM